MMFQQLRKVFLDMNGGGHDESDREREKNTMDGARSKKAVRPEIQIYRPGMMRKGQDITAVEKKEETREGEYRGPRYEQGERRRGDNKGYARTYENSTRRKNYDEQEPIRGSGASTPDRNWSNRNGGGNGAYNQGSRRGQNKERTIYRGGRGGGSGYSSRNGSQYGGSRDDLNSEASYDGRSTTGYNSTQSLLDSRPQPGGYLDYRDQPRSHRSPRRDGTQDVRYNQGYNNGTHLPPNTHSRQLPRNFQKPFDRNTDRASMRAENIHRRIGTGRRRNDSLNSTQSERPASVYAESIPDESRSHAGDLPSDNGVPTTSFADLCASFESMGSINWSQMVEQDFAATTTATEQSAKELKERLEECEKEIERTEREEKSERGILRIDMRTTEETRRGGRGQTTRGGRRERRDSDRSSSVADSIAEELSEGENEEVADGERTPTEEKSYGSGKMRSLNGNVMRSSPRNNNQQHIYAVDYNEKRERPMGGPRLAGRISFGGEGEESADKQRMEREKPSRLRGRVSMDTDRTYQPPARRIQASSRLSSSSQSTPRNSVDDNRESSMTPSTSVERPKDMSEYPIYHEIAQDEGPRMKKLNDRISELLPMVTSRRDAKAADQILAYSASLSDIYYHLLTRDIEFTFSMNLESHLWKQGYHKIIEGLRSASNSSKDGAKSMREVLKKLILNGITFYRRLLSLYESEFSLSVSDCLLWPSGLPLDDLRSVHKGDLPGKQYDTKTHKLAIKSMSRHLIALGDLNRYFALVEASEDYSKAKGCYLRACQLWPSSGHSYNQLAVLSYCAMLYRSRVRMRLTPVHLLSDQRQERVIDETFFLVRALAASHPFEAARDRMNMRLAAMLSKVEKYEPVLDKQFGKSKGDESELALNRDRPRELWIRADGNIMESGEGEEKRGEEMMMRLLEQQPSKLFRRSISYLVACASMLLSKIGMEKFQSISERALVQLAALIRQPNSPITAIQLVQLSTIFIYAVHNADVTNDSETCSVQQQLSVRFLVSLWGILLGPLQEMESHMSQWLTDGEVPETIIRLLPSISLIAEWLSSPSATNIYQHMPSVEPLSSSLHSIDTWSLLASLANRCNSLELDGQLPKEGDKLNDTTLVYLPELSLVSSFSHIFPSPPNPLYIQGPSENQSILSVQCRLRVLFTCAEFLDGSEMQCFTYDPTLKSFVRREMNEGDRLEREVVKRGEEKQTVTDEEPPSSSDARSILLQSEAIRRRLLLVVTPVYILPDTNAFVDHLREIERIVESGRYTLLVSTVVLDELSGLSFAPRITGENNEDHADYVCSQAKVAMSWLKERSKKKDGRVGTLTTRGQKHQMSMLNEETREGMGQTNDDRIVSSCVSFCDSTPSASLPSSITLPSDSVPVRRSLVLISEDRGVQIKAAAQNIPSKTVPSFIKWAGI